MILLNGSIVNVEFFPNKELLLGETLSDLTTESKSDAQIITLKFEDNADFLTLSFVNSWLKEEGFKKIYLYLPYLPYSRMDRKVSKHLFSLKYISDFINFLSFEKVFVLEAHSKVASELINNFISLSVTKELLENAMKKMNFNADEDVIVFPDNGAKIRYEKLILNGIDIIQCSKVRDFNSGSIEFFEIVGELNKPKKRALIIDDLCSRGGTPINVSKACKKIGISETFLAVTHLESNVYTGNLFDEIKMLFTTDALEPFLKEAKIHKQIDVSFLSKNLMLTLKEEF